MKRLAIPALAVILILSACTGSFTLTNKVNKFNKIFENPWVEEVVFLAMVIVPVYEISLIADMLIFNSIEFWTGENPVAEEQQITLTDDVLRRADTARSGRHGISVGTDRCGSRGSRR